MNIPESDSQVLRLTDAFYEQYPDPPYVEILKKRKRGYECILFQTHYDYFVCVPFRTEISHAYAYRFRKSKRAKLHKSGLDYTKIVIIKNTDFIDPAPLYIDQDEYNETIVNIEQIKIDALKFVEDYVKHISGVSLLHPMEFERRYSFSTLKYFHSELGI